MAILSDNQEHQPNLIVENEKLSSLPFNANLDPSNPLVFLESAFTFLSRHSDYLKSDSAEEKIVSMVRSVKSKAEKREEDKKKRDASPSAKKASVEEKKMNQLLAPNKANGLDMEDHSWGQNLSEVNVTVLVPPGTRSRFVLCEIKKEHLKVGLKGEKPIIDEELFEAVKPDDCFWSLEDNKVISILMTKSKDKWWKSLFKGGPEIDTQKAEPEPRRLADLDSETRSVVEKMMFDERQKQLGLPASNEIMKQEMVKQFMAQNPNINFPGVNFPAANSKLSSCKV